MNNKIKEIAMSVQHERHWTEEDIEKFAELIVRECATVQHKRFCEHGDVSWDILIEHFGIKDEQ